MNTTKTLIPLALALALAMPVGAEHCTEPTTSAPEIDALGMFYWDNDLCHAHEGPLDPVVDLVFSVLQRHKCLWSMWVYEESNGIDGLQRGDEVVDDTCHGMIAPDTIIF